MRILRRDQRDAMFDIYSYCRAVDDIADGAASREWRLASLAAWRRKIDALYSGTPPAELTRLALAARRFGLRRQDFLSIIDGMVMDATADIRGPRIEELDLYCDRVASAVGRLAVRVFGMKNDEGTLLAHHLGRALQLTNILRDIDEDAAIGRLYLPGELLTLAGIEAAEPRTAVTDPHLGAVCGFVAERAREHFVNADAVMERSPRETVRAPKIMSEIYRQMLDKMVARGWSCPRQRISVGKPHLLWIAVHHAFI
jgi:phytoene synthase